MHFYPRSPCGERLSHLIPSNGTLHFYPRSPCGERPQRTYQQGEKQAFLSTLSLRRATCFRCCAISCMTISIHALLAESDRRHRGDDRSPIHFYPRSPCGERQSFGNSCTQAVPISIHALLAESDGIGLVFMWWGVRFLSTLSLRRATAAVCKAVSPELYFYPRSPCGERRMYHRVDRAKAYISIHALLAESDEPAEHHANSQQEFLSTLSLRRATLRHCTTYLNCSHFYPRSPCGERQLPTPKPPRVIRFLSTLSLRRATFSCVP